MKELAVDELHKAVNGSDRHCNEKEEHQSSDALDRVEFTQGDQRKVNVKKRAARIRQGSGRDRPHA
jgi:hypothetical protein